MTHCAIVEITNDVLFIDISYMQSYTITDCTMLICLSVYTIRIIYSYIYIYIYIYEYMIYIDSIFLTEPIGCDFNYSL